MAAGTSIPDDWKPTNADREYGLAAPLRLTNEQIDSMAEDMRLWAGANANRAVARKANWSLAFKGWMRREASKLKGTNGYGFGGPRPLQDDSRSASRAAARLGEEARAGRFSFDPIPSLLPESGGNDVRLLPKR